MSLKLTVGLLQGLGSSWARFVCGCRDKQGALAPGLCSGRFSQGEFVLATSKRSFQSLHVAFLLWFCHTLQCLATTWSRPEHEISSRHWKPQLCGFSPKITSLFLRCAFELHQGSGMLSGFRDSSKCR